MKRITSILGVLCLLAAAGCGDDDGSGQCSSRADCSDHGDCGTDGTCDCDTGYLGDTCDACDTGSGYTEDGNGDCVLSGCADGDGDGHDVYDPTACPAGDDYCDGDADNYTENGCANCVDADGDGYGSDCDLGTDCDDTDDQIHTGCSGCVDADGDTYGVNCTPGPDCNDNNAAVHDGCYRVWFWGDFDTDETHEVGFRVYPGGDKTTMTLTGINTSNWINGVSVSPDGGQVAVAGSSGANMSPVLIVYNADGSGTPLTLATGGAGQEFRGVSFSPDGAWVAFRWDEDFTNAFGLYVVEADGSGTPKRVHPALTDANFDVSYFRWAPTDGTAERHIAFRADLDTDEVFGLWTVEISAANPTPVAIVPTADVVAGAEVAMMIRFDSQRRVYFKSDFEQLYQYRVYRADLDGANREQVPGTALTNGNGEAAVGSFGISNSGTVLAFSIDAPTNSLYQVYTMDLSGTTASIVSDVSTAAPPSGDYHGPSFYGSIIFSQDDQHLAVIADWPVSAGDLDNAYSAFVLPASGTAGGVRLTGVPNNAALGADLGVFSPDAGVMFIRGDLAADNVFELFMTADITTADQAPATILEEDVPTGGEIRGIWIAPVP
ncbi:MAG: calcium-binding EGF-like domain-containing protein [bacterium]